MVAATRGGSPNALRLCLSWAKPIELLARGRGGVFPRSPGTGGLCVAGACMAVHKGEG
uniref:Uncharacterized protein n=1 Tax=Anguilla anguilla TaxID=7936 RepID=A0A0E9R8G3_ANGAN